jgi:hypothetical protein
LRAQRLLLPSKFIRLTSVVSYFLETQRVCGTELSELLIKHGFGVTTGGLMKPIRWSAHARKKAAKREVQENEVERTIARPDSIAPGQWRRQIFMRRYFDAILETEMLLRVVIEETDTELTVVTLYKTSKFAKYEGGA